MDSSRLNPPQREAVMHGTGPLLVLAGAGSGKTRVITHRIARLVDSGVSPKHIVALTFTNKAAEEMRARVAALLRNDKAAGELTMGTFHSLGLRILKQERKVLGFPRGFVIYDTADQLGAVREIMRRIHIVGAAGVRRFDPGAVLTRISLAKNAFISPDDYEPAESDEYDEITAEVYPKYEEALLAYAAVDFDDLITRPVRLMDKYDDIRDRWQNAFRYVLVDEYQDTNRAQLMMVKHLAYHGNLCVVGDDDQSIYSWRGADTANILTFEKMFPGAKVVKLEQNYRSTTTILAAANAVIANNTDRHDKKLWSARPDGPLISCATAPDPATEAQFVAREINDIRSDTGRPYGDFAILYRSNVQARLLEEELREHRIPYVMYGGQQFYERKEVKDLIAYMRVALNPRDEIGLRRIINYPARGIGTTTVARLSAWAQANRTTLWNALRRGDEQSDAIRTGTRRAIAELVQIIDQLSGDLRGAGAVAGAKRLNDTIDLYGDLRAASPNLTAAQHRIDNVEMLFRSLQRFQDRSPGPDALQEYLRQLSLARDDAAQLEVADNRVTLTTLHGAKGLEFPIVFFIGLEEELIPHARTLNPQSTDVIDSEHASDVSEERRLAYVGITRAQDRLIMSRSLVRARYGKLVERTPSRFLLEIPPELLEQRDIAAEAATPASEEEVADFFSSFTGD